MGCVCSCINAVNTMKRCIVSKSVNSWIEGLGSSMVYNVGGGGSMVFRTTLSPIQCHSVQSIN